MDLNIEGEGVVEARPSEMVERVARALQEGTERNPISDLFAQHLARLAIEAMLEPTEAMVQAGWGYDGEPWAIWRQMITAALSPSGADR